MQNNLRQVTRAVSDATKKLDANTAKLRDEMMLALVQLSKEEIKGRRPAGQKAISGQPPMNRTGNLRRSIRGERTRSGLGTYEAIVGPTIVYGRAVEIGGVYRPPTWKSSTRFPYMAPAYKKLMAHRDRLIRKHLVTWK